MKTGLFVMASAAAIALGVAAHAEETTGTITDVNDQRMTVTLDNGIVYTLKRTDENRDALKGLNPGDTLAVNWAMSGTEYLVQNFTFKG